MAAGQDAPATDEMDKIVKIKDNVCVGPFQAEILKGRVARVSAHDTHLMVVPIRHADVENRKARQLPPGLQVLHAYTTLTAGSKQVLIVVQNMTDSAIFLKKGVHVAHVVSATLVPTVEVPLEQFEGKEAPREWMSVQEQHHTQRWDWRIVGLCGSFRTLTCSSQWLPLRWQTPRSEKNIGTSTRVFLVAINGWWLSSIRGCHHCEIFEGAVVKAPLCPIQAPVPLELVHVWLHQQRNNYGAQSAAECQKCLGPYGSLHKVCDGICQIRKQKLLHEFSMSDSSQCLVHQLNCSVTKAWTSPLH